LGELAKSIVAHTIFMENPRESEKELLSDRTNRSEVGNRVFDCFALETLASGTGSLFRAAAKFRNAAPAI
jgi:hypothetical protein